MITEQFKYTSGWANIAVVVERFNDVSEWYKRARTCRHTPYRIDFDFYGHANMNTCVRYCEDEIGEAQMRKAKELVGKVDASFRDRERDQWAPSPYGAYPVVPDYLAGDPFSMRLKHRDEDNRAPIRYYIEAVVSGGTSQHDMEQRAAGIAALAMRTAEDRPVELYAVIALKMDMGYCAVIPISTHPIDLKNTIAMFATRENARMLAFGNGSTATGNDFYRGCDWLFGHPDQGNKGDREKLFRQVLGMDPQDVLMQGGYLSDAYEFGRDPVKWVHDQIEKQREVTED